MTAVYILNNRAARLKIVIWPTKEEILHSRSWLDIAVGRKTKAFIALAHC